MLSLEDAWRGMRLLKEAGMKKLNFAGGEPFLYPKFLGNLLRYGKVDLQIESIGRGKQGNNIETLKKIASWFRAFGIKFKINTVVCSLNWNEDLTRLITQLQPFRWKVFQCLIVTGENDNEERKRDARLFLVSQQQWQTFCDRHKHLECFVPESNDMMKGSYLILDENMSFLDKGDGEERASESILDVGVKTAMSQVRWERTTFLTRGGVYDWTKARSSEGCGIQENKELEW
ncbi:hypothetical protein HYALB_00005106 [Hymenoscyphus albidus]|uniref:Radical SAM core domain-containing protein n=1 Tax=Hymenoscyphus albidus TaxID=595503 RepID=A0A9N9M1E1_9HELO|nr:hypothetical protein HYALB_00005106 [Hymenoscyphus albidus]